MDEADNFGEGLNMQMNNKNKLEIEIDENADMQQ